MAKRDDRPIGDEITLLIEGRTGGASSPPTPTDAAPPTRQTYGLFGLDAQRPGCVTDSYAVLRNRRTFGRFPRAFMACHRSHFACSASQICASEPVSASAGSRCQH